MTNDWNPDEELERLEKARERIRQLRAKVKFLNDKVSGSWHDTDAGERLRKDGEPPSGLLPPKFSR